MVIPSETHQVQYSVVLHSWSKERCLRKISAWKKAM